MKKYYDIHCHFFTKEVLSKRIFTSLVPLIELMNNPNEFDLSDKISTTIQRFDDFLDVFTKSSAQEVFSGLEEEYNSEFNFTPLMFDLTYSDDNEQGRIRNFFYRKRRELFLDLIEMLIPWFVKRIENEELKKRLLELKDEDKSSLLKLLNQSDDAIEDKNFAKQIEDLSKLSANNTSVLPFFSIDPRRYYKDQEDVARQAFSFMKEKPPVFYGIKLYAPAGFSPTDPYLFGTDQSYAGVYQHCQDNNIPLTVHCSDGGFACLSNAVKIRGHINLNGTIKYFANEKYTFDKKFFSLQIGEAIKERAKILNHPRLWELVFQKFPNLKLNLAHFGGSGELMEYVEYKIPFSDLSSGEFEDILEVLNSGQGKTVKSFFKKSGRKYSLDTSILPSKKKELWNALYYGGVIDNWAKRIFDIVRNKNYPNAYTDLSCYSEGTMINKNYRINQRLKVFKTDFFDRLNDYEKGKLLYGSDFALNTLFGPTMENYIKDFKEVFEDDFDIIASANPAKFLYDN